MHGTIHAGVLQQHREGVGRAGRVGRAGDHVDAQRRRACAHHFEGLWQHVVGDEEGRRFVLADAHRERHRFGGGGGFVEYRGAGDGHAGQVANQGLEVDQRLHAALRNLGLVRRVGRVPGRVLEHVAQDHAGRVGAVIALTDEALQQPVLAGDGFQLGQRLRFGERRGQRHRRAARDRARHDGLDQRVARHGTDHRQHVAFIDGVDADVAGDEFAGVLELAQRPNI